MDHLRATEPTAPVTGLGLSDDPEVLKLQLTPFTSEAFREAWFSGMRILDTEASIEEAIPRETGEVPEHALSFIRPFMAQGRVVLCTMPGQKGAFLVDLGQGVYLLLAGLDGSDPAEAARCIRLFVNEAFITRDCTRIVCRIEPGDVLLSQALQESGFRHEHTLPNGRHMVLNLDEWLPGVGARWFLDQCAAVGEGAKGMQAFIRHCLLFDDWQALGRTFADFAAKEPTNQYPSSRMST